MEDKHVWETLENIHNALAETFSTANKTAPKLRAHVCVNGRCEQPDCSICDAVDDMRRLLGIDD